MPVYGVPDTLTYTESDAGSNTIADDVTDDCTHAGADDCTNAGADFVTDIESDERAECVADA